MIKHKLSNVIFCVESHMANYPEAYYRIDGKAAVNVDSRIPSDSFLLNHEETKSELSFSGTIDFLTYFNCCSVGKWRQFANLEKINLHIELAGDPCTIQFVGIADGDEFPIAISEGERLSTGFKVSGVINGSPSNEENEPSLPFEAYDVALPGSNKTIVGFTLQTRGTAVLRNAYYYAEVEESKINQINLAIVTTTFKKEQYITSNIDLIEKTLLNSGSNLFQSLHLFVIDNGCTLEVKKLSNDMVTIISNKNVGGSGGFTRGMMEALSRVERFTHVLLMDDDVIVSPESIERTFNLLTLAQGKYRNAFINGGMITAEQPNLLYEDISFVLKSGVHHRIKGDLYIDHVKDIVKNEAVNVEVPNAFGGWWFSCIPVAFIKRIGLPFPFFVRVDDVEYAMRAQPDYMTMNGICVWHEGFGGRFRPSVDVYQYSRNFFIMIALDDCCSEQLYFRRWERNVRLFLRTMEYDTVDLFLDAFEDYLKGPEFIASADGEAIMKKNSAKNEKFLPVNELRDQFSGREAIELEKYSVSAGPGRLIRVLRTLPYDRHLLPEFALRSKPEPMKRGRLAPFSPKAAGTKTLIVFEEDGTSVSIRRMNKARYKKIMERLKRLKKDYRVRGAEVRAAYKEAKPWLTSWDFWNEYLGTDLKPAE